MSKTYNIIVVNYDGNNLYTITEMKASNKEEACGMALIKYIEHLKQNRHSNNDLFAYKQLPERIKVAEVIPTQYETINLRALAMRI